MIWIFGIGIILSINVIYKSRIIIYGTYLNGNFYLIKINIPHPKKYNITLIMISITDVKFILKIYA